jgi:hypothetical protein
MPTDTNHKTVQNRVRRKAARNGYGIRKSRCYVDGWDNQGEYMLFDVSRNFCVLGPRCDATLEEIEAWLDQPEE